MKRFSATDCVLMMIILGLGLIPWSFATPSQVEFVARIQAIQTSPGGAELTLNLTPAHTITVRATSATEVRDQADLPISIASLSAGSLVKVEGIFADGGILALEIEVTETAEDFELRGQIDALTPEGSNLRLEVLGFSILATPGTEIEDAAGNRLFPTELEVGLRVKVEGRATPNDLVAREIKLLVEDDGFARIRISGTVSQIESNHIFVSIIGGTSARVEISASTEIQGDLVIGSQVDVLGRLTPELAIQAERISVQGLFRLLPDEIHLEPEGLGRVEIVLNQEESEDLVFELTSMDPAIAAPTSDQVVLPAGTLSASFEVAAGLGEARTMIRVTSPTLGGASRLLEVEVETQDQSNDDGPGDGNDDSGNDDDPDSNDGPGDEFELEVKWNPRKLSNPSPGQVAVELRLNQPAPSDLEINLSVKDGNPALVSFPSSVDIPSGQLAVSFMIEIQAGSGEVKIRAALPGGGDTDDLEIEVRPSQAEQVKLTWAPDKVEERPGSLVTVALQLDQAAPVDFKVILTVKSGDPTLIQGFPAEIEFAQGQSQVSFQVQLGAREGRVEFTAAIPFQLGGDTETIRFEIED